MMCGMPFTLVQLTDPHIGAPWSDDPIGALDRALAAIPATLGGAPDALLVSGDIANNQREIEYEHARSALERLGVPVYAIPGNHDDPDRLRRALPPPDGDPGSLSYAVSVGPMRLVALDSTRAGEARGELDRDRLRWLDGALEADRTTPTLIAMHHPPIATGLPAMDAIAISDDERAELAAVLARHPQVQMIAAGHVHRAVVSTIATVPVLAVPSSDVQLAFDLAATEIAFTREPPCFAVHLLVDGRIVSHIQPIATSSG